MMSREQRQKADNPMGPANPQALNRYSYVQNNPLRWSDPSGHFGVTTYAHQGGAVTLHLTHDEATALWQFVTSNGPTKLGIGIGLLQLAGFADGIAPAVALASTGASVQAVTIAAIVGSLGFGAASLSVLAGAVGGVLESVDQQFGENGVDIHLLPGNTFVITAPTVERQEGVWVAGYLGAPASRTSDDIFTCLARRVDC